MYLCIKDHRGMKMKNEIKYTARYFHDTMPEWKRRKDPLIARVFYRPISFLGASWCASLGFSANVVSYFSAIVAVISCLCYLPENKFINLTGAILINFWEVLDCIDGNLARSVKKEPFGEFADAFSSYLLVGIMGICFGYNVYQQGGFIVKQGHLFMIILGAAFSEADTFMRLVHQKFINTEREMIEENNKDIEMIDIEGGHHGNKLKHIEESAGIGGVLPLLILLGTIFHAIDILIFYCAFMYGCLCTGSVSMYLNKSIKRVSSTLQKQ